MATKKQTTTKAGDRYVIVTTQYRDLYYGTITATDQEIASTHSVRVSAARHIAYWHGPKGGLTSLAAQGPEKGSRIGVAIDSMLVTGVAHVLDVTEAARARFAAIQ